MSDRYIIDVACPYCGEYKKVFWYAPGCGSDSHDCEKCHKRFFVVNCCGYKVERIKAKDLLRSFLDSLNMWSPDEDEQKAILEQYNIKIAKAIKHNEQCP